MIELLITKILANKTLLLSIGLVMALASAGAYVYHLKSSLENLELQHALLESNYNDQIATIDKLTEDSKKLETIIVKSCEEEWMIEQDLWEAIAELPPKVEEPTYSPRVELVDENAILYSDLPVSIINRLRKPADED